MNSRIGLLLFGIAMTLGTAAIAALNVIMEIFSGESGPSSEKYASVDLWILIVIAQIIVTFFYFYEPEKKRVKVIFFTLATIIQIAIMVPFSYVSLIFIGWLTYLAHTTLLFLAIARLRHIVKG